MLRKRLFLSAIIAASLNAPFAQAADVDIRPRVAAGKIVTDGYEDATATQTPDVRVFGYEFGDDAEDPLFAEDPGFNAADGSGLTPGKQVRFTVLGSSSYGLAGNLTLAYWNATGPIEFGEVPSQETLKLQIGSQSRTVGFGHAGGPIAGFNIETVDAIGAIHQHFSSFLQGADGNSVPANDTPLLTQLGDGVEPAEGIYLAALVLRQTEANGGATSTADSAPIFVLFNNQASSAAFDNALQYVTLHYPNVPEPASLVLLAAGSAGLAFAGATRRAQGRSRLKRSST